MKRIHGSQSFLSLLCFLVRPNSQKKGLRKIIEEWRRQLKFPRSATLTQRVCLPFSFFFIFRFLKVYANYEIKMAILLKPCDERRFLGSLYNFQERSWIFDTVCKLSDGFCFTVVIKLNDGTRRRASHSQKWWQRPHTRRDGMTRHHSSPRYI